MAMSVRLRSYVERPRALPMGPALLPGSLLKNSLFRRLLKKAQMQGGARIPHSALRIPQWRDGPFSAAC
jgi:hypothetical protein